MKAKWFHRKFIVFPALIILFSSSCAREESCSDSYETVEAIVVDSGEPSEGGCGWLVQADDSMFYPVNLSDAYKKDLLTVTLAYGNMNENHSCGTHGGSYPSVQIYCIKPLNFKKEVAFLPEDQTDKLKMDMYRIHSAKLKGDSLSISVSFGGGCMVHQFRLWKLPQKAGEPATAELFLAHDANGDGCQALLWKTLTFSLKPLRIRGKNQITIWLRGSPEMSAHYGTYEYNY